MFYYLLHTTLHVSLYFDKPILSEHVLGVYCSSFAILNFLSCMVFLGQPFTK